MTPYSFFRSGVTGVLAAALLLTSVSCSRPLTTREKGALIGGGAGAGIGGLTGGGTGAAIGGAAGALGGAVVGDQIEKRDRERYYDDDY
ncbi:MAG: YMGG-like glycine zipper-containing protein [Thermodesulfobacteriota bacterium]|jgi:outer membrane lipoprotein SlyB